MRCGAAERTSSATIGATGLYDWRTLILFIFAITLRVEGYANRLRCPRALHARPTAADERRSDDRHIRRATL